MMERVLHKSLRTSFTDLWEAKTDLKNINDIDALKNISLKCIQITEVIINGKIEVNKIAFRQFPTDRDIKYKNDNKAYMTFLSNLGKVKPQISEEKDIDKLKDYVKDAVDMCGKTIYGKEEFERIYGKSRKRKAKKN